MISPIGSFDLVMVVDKASKLKTVSEAIAQARKDPADFNIGTVGVGSTQNLAAQLFVAMAGLEAQVVPFRSSGDVVSALRGGLQAGFETMPAVLPQIRSGKLLPLAVSGSKRFASCPAHHERHWSHELPSHVLERLGRAREDSGRVCDAPQVQ